ncbi:uncharacterized protein LOC124181593 [Neodiprion fabricii]|uniref:uncharacterized protein LOC124181593 n=1 Tax=Neodiprion fabricii TaxID=2872261 RepID=UPI001ED8E863|nr:uncharacterized protein LOC124181593 [Neodiprion fabricii]XP_046424256.1 uncharacterized protein LOC124181593 [Neodiprion fabricii]
MNRILVILSMTVVAVFGNAIMQPVHDSSSASSQQQTASSSGASPGVHQTPSYTGVAITPQNSYSPYFPTYPEYNDQRYSVQTGYEGYVVSPEVAVEEPQATGYSGLWSVMSPISRFALTYGARAGGYFLNLLLLLLLGGIFTTSVCTFTPLCTITLLGLGKAQVREQVSELARTYMTPERISAATGLVKTAIDKYAAMQTQPIKEETNETDKKS